MNIPEKQLAKAQAFWAAKAERRRTPGRCGRCGKKNTNGHGQCDECRAWFADYRARKRQKLITVEVAMIEKLERRIANLEHYWAHVSRLGYVQYKRGYRAGQRIHRKSAERASYFDAMPHATAQELAKISHEFAR